MAENISMYCTMAIMTSNADILKLFGNMASSTRGWPARLVLERILQSTPQRQGEFVHRSTTVTSYGLVIEFNLVSRKALKRFSQANLLSGSMVLPSLDGEFGYLLDISPIPRVTLNGSLPSDATEGGTSAGS